MSQGRDGQLAGSHFYLRLLGFFCCNGRCWEWKGSIEPSARVFELFNLLASSYNLGTCASCIVSFSCILLAASWALLYRVTRICPAPPWGTPIARPECTCESHHSSSLGRRGSRRVSALTFQLWGCAIMLTGDRLIVLIIRTRLLGLTTICQSVAMLPPKPSFFTPALTPTSHQAPMSSRFN